MAVEVSQTVQTITAAALPTLAGIFLPELTSPGSSQTISVVFQPQLDNGLVLMVTDANGSLPLLAVGLLNGELLLSNFSGGSFSLLPSVCNPGNPTFYNLSLTFTEGLVDVTVKGAGREGRSQLPFFLGQERLLLTVGNIPPGFIIPGGSDIFRFLLSATSHVPPGLFGCVSDVMVGSDGLLQLDTAFMEHIMIGFCPSA